MIVINNNATTEELINGKYSSEQARIEANGQFECNDLHRLMIVEDEVEPAAK